MNVPTINWKFVLLFATAYCGSLGYFWLMDRFLVDNAAYSATAAEVVEPKTSAPEASKDMVAVAAEISTSSDGGKTRLVGQTEQTGPVTPLMETDVLSESTRKHVLELSGQATTAPTMEGRSKAIMKLRSAAKTPESVQALTEVLHSDTAVRNRLFAVTALRSLATQGDDDGAIRTALGQASADEDRKVADAARNAYEHVRSLTAADVRN
jgi:hypothetical protein